MSFQAASSLFELLLRVYPRDFRDRYGDDLRSTFLVMVEDGRGGVFKVGRWTAAAGDLLRSGLRERWKTRSQGAPGDSLVNGRGGKMTGWIRDVRSALRALLREPLFVLVAAGSLTIGIGANTAVLSVADAALFQTMPGIAQPDRVVELGRSHQGEGFDTFSYPDFLDLRTQVPALQGAAAFSIEVLSLTRGGEGVRGNGVLVSPEYFQVLGVSPGRGRYFTEEEDEGAGEHAVAVVTHAFWQAGLGGDPNVLGSELRVNRLPFTVVGVTPPGFRGHLLGLETDVYMPMVQAPVLKGRNDLENRGASWHMALGLLAPQATLEQLNAQLLALGERLAAEHPETNRQRGYRALPLGPIPGAGRGGIRLFIAALLGAVALVLLVTCTNVAGMFLARGLSRDKEMAIRRALGAGRGRLVRQLTIETLLVFAVGGGLGIALGAWSIGLIRPDGLPFPTPVRFRFRPDLGVVGWAGGLTLVAGLFFGLLPAMQASNTSPGQTLRSGSVTAGRGRGRLRATFAGAQIGLSLVLLVAAGLFLRSLQRASAVETGFDPVGAYTVYLDLGLEGYDQEGGTVFQTELLTELRALSWVSEASLSGDLPLDLARSSTSVYPDGWDDAPGEPSLGVDFNRVSDGYFETLGIPLVEGRTLRDTDRDGSARVAVVTEAFVEAAWPGEEALGRTVRLGRGETATRFEVVGVVADVKNQIITESPAPFLYLPLGQSYRSGVQVVVRTDSEAAYVIPELRRALLSADPSLSLGSIVSLERYTSVGLLPQRIAAALTSGLGLLTLLLSGMGVYGVVSYSVGRRKREIGIRLALGETQGSIVARVLRSGLAFALPGMLVGAVLSVLAAGVLRALLLDLSPYDPAALGGVAALLLGVVLTATWVPARRASRVDPVRSLRAE